MVLPQFYLPGWLYERLPHAYVTSGFSTLLALAHLLAWFGRALLMGAGLLVWKVRRDSRRPQR